VEILLNSIALEPNRWTKEKTPHVALEELLAPVARAGFHALEVWQNHVALLDREGLDALAERAEALGVAIPVVGMYPRFHLEGRERDAELARLEVMLGIMDALGAEMLKIMPGTLASAEMTPQLWDRSAGFAREMLDRTRSRNITIPCETHSKTVADDPDALLRFLETVGSDRLKVCWQPLDFEDTQGALELYDRLAPHVTHVHLQGRRGGEMELLEAADIDYARVLGHIFAGGFDGYVSIEFARGCVVDSPEQFDLEEVLESAATDRAFIEAQPGFRS